MFPLRIIALLRLAWLACFLAAAANTLMTECILIALRVRETTSSTSLQYLATEPLRQPGIPIQKKGLLVSKIGRDDPFAQ
jgi:hypothetical protein